ncbi:MAG: hypothetical protein VKJ46_05090 [Leptolyngbyaceae bacterium]|nr:hypothetical protein [Leptolyngbyaceae bacterium]
MLCPYIRLGLGKAIAHCWSFPVFLVGGCRSAIAPPKLKAIGELYFLCEVV